MSADNIFGGHRCFGCGGLVVDYKSHIHFSLDEWAAKQGHEPVGLDDLFAFTFCEDCTETSEDGWTLESHEVDE